MNGLNVFESYLESLSKKGGGGKSDYKTLIKLWMV